MVAKPLTFLNTIKGDRGFRIEGRFELGAAGYAVAGIGDFNGDGFDDILVGAPYVQPPFYYGTAYVILGKQDRPSVLALDSLSGSDGFSIGSSYSGDRLGVGVTGVGDFNDDGMVDLAVGRDGANFDGKSNVGATHIIFGTETPLANYQVRNLDGSTGRSFYGGSKSDRSGQALGGDGFDFDDDGTPDLVIGAVGLDSDNPALIFPGGAYVVFGSDSTTAIQTLTANQDGILEIPGAVSGQNLGTDVAGIGDVNGDGIDDLLVAAKNDDRFGSDSGSVFLIFGNEARTAPALDALDGKNGVDINLGADANNRFGTNSFVQDRLGAAVDSAGDFNGDGIEDFIITSDFKSSGASERSTGVAYVIFGRNDDWDSGDFNPSRMSPNEGLEIRGEQEFARFGESVAGIGDFNKDGFDDVAIGAPRSDANRGSVYIVFGREATDNAVFDVDAIDGTNGLKFNGRGNEDRMGTAVAGAGDMNNDGFADVVMGGPENSTVDGGTGEIFVVYGFRTPTNSADRLFGDEKANRLNGLDGADTIIGNGGLDTLIGGDGNDRLIGDKQNDSLVGGRNTDRLLGWKGNDTLNAGDGNDFLEGGEGRDRLLGWGGKDDLKGGDGNDTMDGGIANDTLFGADGWDSMIGGRGRDLMEGGRGRDTLKGWAGNDTLRGDDSRDRLEGGSGNDALGGGNADDILVGQGGRDTAWGGNGSDRFEFADNWGRDVIRDFDTRDNAEVIDLRGVTGIIGWADLRDNHLTRNGDGDAVIVDGGNQITLDDVSRGQLDSGDFWFVF